MQQRRRGRGLDARKVIACGAVGVICLALIALIWINTDRTITIQQDDMRDRVEAVLGAQAATLALQAQRELQMIDQSLSVLQAVWDNDPDTFSLADWHKKMPALTAVSADLFIANDKHVIVQDIIPAAIGQGIGSAYATFADGSLEPIQPQALQGGDGAAVISALGNDSVSRQYMMYMVRPLLKPQGWLIGASYKSGALTQVFAAAGLGQGGFAAMVDTKRGGVQAVAGTAALHPKLVLANTPLYKAILAQPDGGKWIGRTPIDGVRRIIEFRHIPGRELVVLVGESTADAMAPAAALAPSARFLAVAASLLVVAIGGTVLWEVWHWRRTRYRRRALAETQAMLDSVQAEFASVRNRITVREAQLQTLLGSVTDGAALIDREQRLVAWNAPFAALTGLDNTVLREGVLLDELLRQQVLAGRFGAVEDTEAEIARRLELLRPEAGAVEVGQTAPDGTTVVLHARPLPDGGSVLILRPAAIPAVSEAAEPEPTGADSVEL